MSDMSLEVLKEKPRAWRFGFGGVANGVGLDAAGFRDFFHYCKHCGGWVRGKAAGVRESTLMGDQLVGRSGWAYHCLRCGGEILFDGVMA